MKEHVDKIFLEAPLWFLATCHDNVPNVVPVGFKWIEGDRLLIADLFLGKTRRNIHANPEVAVAVGALGPKRGFQIKGTAQVLTQGPEFAQVKDILIKDGLDQKLIAVIAVTPQQLFLLDPGADAGQELAL